ncbi:MAG: helix-turn-helix domain-containing protein [Actinomycetota bacterium]|nr:helix-turn-helix domain-containing protein [Actinomycetota bacterium]
MACSPLSAEERDEILIGNECGASLSEIARSLGCAPSTICREVAANGGRHWYRAVKAQRRAEREPVRPKRHSSRPARPWRRGWKPALKPWIRP